LTVGNLRFRVVSVPGHTPGSTTFVHGLHAFVATPSSPGPRAFAHPQDCARDRLDRGAALRPAGRHHDLPGHGDRTTIGLSKREFALSPRGARPSSTATCSGPSPEGFRRLPHSTPAAASYTPRRWTASSVSASFSH
jgi:glyoxylase-like metal-dependent hydrolase (beta-lactamase superfamily II)